MLTFAIFVCVAAGSAAATADVDPPAPSPTGAPDPATPSATAGSFIGPSGILADGVQVVLLEADTELAGYPTAIIGWRTGIADRLDLGIELGGIDVAFLGRLHAKVKIWESADRAWYTGLRLRTEAKRHHQTFDPGVFREIDDAGMTLVPALSAARRFGEQRDHGVHLTAFWYVDIDFRPEHPVENYTGIIAGYEHRFAFGLFIQADLGIGFELFEPVTEGEPIPKVRLVVGYGFD